MLFDLSGLLGPTISAAPAAPLTSLNTAWVVIGACLTLLAAAGAWLLSAPEREATATQVLGITLAALAFFATGFAFAMGGVGGAQGGLGPIIGLGREWIPLGEGRGLLGLQGFFLAGAAYDPGVYALFLFQAAALLVAAVIAIVPWAGRAPRLVVVVYSLLFGGLLYPAFANWAWGGGWLALLGQTKNLGHGLVDYAGSGVINGAAGLAALGAFLALRPAQHAEAEPANDDHRLLAGLALFALGMIGLNAASTYAMTETRLAIAAANTLVALVCAASVGLLYTWFVAGEPDLAIATRAGVAGLVAVAAGAPFFPAWAAALAGGMAGLLVPFAGYVLERLLHVRERALVVAAHGVAGVWGLLVVGIMADGRFGAGWNGIGEREYLGVTGQGVTGVFPAALIKADAGQLSAQVIGAVTLLAFPVATYVLVRVLTWAVARRAVAPATAAAIVSPETDETSARASNE